MSNELTTATAEKINEVHAYHKKVKQAAIDNFKETVLSSVEAGGYIKEISKGQRIAWLRDNCPDITQKEIKAYLSIEARYNKRNNMITCHDFFGLLGMTSDDQKERGDNPMKSAMPQWLAWSGKLTGFFCEMTKKTPPEQWSDTYKTSVAEQLKPIVEIYQRITGGSSIN